MSKFPESEGELLQRYLEKDHRWRTGKAPAVERGLIDNNYPLDLEALGQTAWKNFTAMFGCSKVKELPYRQTLSSQSYMWSFGCGGRGPESASDISNTTNFTTDPLQTVFTLLFGSYFGDWDYPNNFLRAAIASRTCLASTWEGPSAALGYFIYKKTDTDTALVLLNQVPVTGTSYTTAEIQGLGPGNYCVTITDCLGYSARVFYITERQRNRRDRPESGGFFTFARVCEKFAYL